MKLLTACLALTLLASVATAADIGYVEDFALAKDRLDALRVLIPGTEDYYYYTALHHLNTEQFDKLEPLVKPWLERFGRSHRLIEIQTRAAMLTYNRDPKKSLNYLRGRLGVPFNHEKPIADGPPNLPTTLDQKLIARATLKDRSLTAWSDLHNFEDAALDWVATENLDWERRRHLLARLTRPDIANLPTLIVEDLKSQRAGAFGSLPIHRMLTLAQLDELVKLRPDLLNHPAYVQVYLGKLQPNADEDWRRNPAQTRAYFDRVLAFTRRLAPVHNALKAHALYQRLAFDRAQGVHDKALFLEYVKLPRLQHYMPRAMNESNESRMNPAQLNADFRQFTLMPPINVDEELVRAYLLHFLATADSPKEFAAYIDGDYLRHLFAEGKIVAGLGDVELWASQLPPEMYRLLKDRIDIDFAPTSKANYATDENVRLDLHVKNVPTLIVKVFEINALNFYRQNKREVDTDINLDGLVANSEQTFTYTDAPARRTARSFDFPQLKKPGVYVVDFIGGGKSSRALVRKGRLTPLVATGTAGQVVTVVDESKKPVPDATLWLNGQEYKAAADGRIIVPFSTQPARQPIVLSRGDFASLDTLQHQPENYNLVAGIHIDREALLSQRLAAVMIRPGLYLNGIPVSVKLLEEVKLRIVATDDDGIATSSDVTDFKLFEDRESTHEFRVPPRLASLSVTLSARVKSLSLGKPVDLASSESFALNGIDKTEKVEDLHFAKFGDDYAIEVLGRSGEPRADRPVRLALKHRDFREAVQVTLKSDVRGRVQLGALADIASIAATGPEGTSHTWTPPTDRFTYRQVLHAKAGETVTLPYVGREPKATRDEFALFDVRGTTIRADRFEALEIKDGTLELRGLAAGDYDLWLKRSGERVRVRIVDGTVQNGYVLGALRDMQLPALKPVQIVGITYDADAVTVRLRDASPFARVHVIAGRYRPAYSAFGNLAKVRAAELAGGFPARADSTYLSGRNIGDEYRYVLDRKYQRKYPGVMLDRPALLLNPWAIRSTETDEQAPQGGDSFRSGGGSAPASAIPSPKPASSEGGAGGDFANLDFLGDASAVLVNLVPDKDGLVRIPRKEIAGRAMLQVVAVDPLHVESRSLALPETATKFLDLRLRAGLDPQGHFTQQKQVSVLTSGQPFSLADAAASRFEAYDSLAKVHGLYGTLTSDPKLAEFAFVLNWPNLKPEEKRTLYSKHACHELSFFLARKDPAFFSTVVKPYLANKKDKTFLDHWLLEDDLAEYAQPWRFGRLNAVERVLLARRLPNEPTRVSRYMTETFRLLPPNADRLQMLFETAVKGGSLDDSVGLGVVQLQRQLSATLPADAKPSGMPPPAPPGAPGGGGMGGFGGGMGGPGSGPAAGNKPKGAPGKPGEEGIIMGDADGITFRDGKGDRKKLAKAEEKLNYMAERTAGLAKDAAGDFLTDDRGAVGIVAPLYRRLDPTREWAENNYYNLLAAQQTADLVGVNPFWLDYSKHDGKAPFLSRHLADAGRNFTEMMFALAVLDLPFAAGKHEIKFDGGRMTFTPAGPVIAFHEEVRPVGAADGKVQILVSQNFFRQGDRYREENGERFDKFVTAEFVVHTVYGCQLVVTNPTPSRQKLSALIQIPVGAVPVGNGQRTKSVALDLEPYRTQVIDYTFYFPAAGRYNHFPVHVAKGESLVASAAPFVFNVVDKPSRLDTESWEYVSRNGSTEQVLAFLNRENVHALDLELIAFRMRDAAFFDATIRLLSERHAYSSTLWSYGLYHDNLAAAREYLSHSDQIVGECGGPIASPLLTINPVDRFQYEHLEYKPLVNARAHSLGQRRAIVNAKLHEQYHRFLKTLTYRASLSDDDQLAVCHYLLTQDRVEEAGAAFAKVRVDLLATRMQYDYCAAYLDLSSDEPMKARSVAMKYANHPVDRWRNAFGAIANQLDEIEGKGPKVADADDQAQRQAMAASKEPNFELTVDAKAVNLSWQNLETVRVNYYLMDVELLFSQNPFVQQSGGQFSSIRPNATREVKLPAGQSKLAVPLPDDLVKRNVLIEVTANGKTRALPYYANAMNLQMTENYGQLRVADQTSGKALAKVYVKAYLRLADGTVKFHKDGYTDHRGRFDYASVSTPDRAPPSRYSILVLSEDHGAQIREAAPPQQ